MTIKTVMKKMLRMTIEWAILIGLTMLVLWVDGFWATLGVMWVTCFIASAVTVIRALSSGKMRLVLPAPPATPEPGRDDCDDFLLFAEHITE
jgi:hypothetical protein